MAGAYSNHRRFPRIRSENPVLVKKLDDESIGAFSKTRQVGLGGCMFLNDEAIGTGTTLEVFISVQGRVIRSKARVVYELPRAGQYEIGVEFLEIDPVEKSILERLFEESPG